MESAQINTGVKARELGKSLEGGEALLGRDLASQPLYQISDIVAVLVMYKNWKFILGDDDVDAMDIADPQSLLGPILWQAEKKFRVGYTGDFREVREGASLGIKFVADSQSSVGSRPILEAAIGSPRSPSIIFLYDVLNETFENFKVNRDTASLDALVQEFRDDNAAGLVPWVVDEPGKTLEVLAPN